MDNQYNYYKPEDRNMNSVGGDMPKPQKPKSHGFKKFMVVVSLAVMFGLVGGVTFQATSYVTARILGTDKKGTTDNTDNTEGTKKVSNAQLTTAKSTITSDVSDIVDSTIPSIVSITNMSIQQVQSFFGGISQQEIESAGSGIIISQNDSELLIVTNNHVVEGNKTLTVTFHDGQSVEAKVKGTDSTRDLAVVAVPLADIPAETMGNIKVATLGDSDSLKVGEPAIAIGNALGYGQSVTSGIISATTRSIDGFDGVYIQTDAAINPGNSGGALLNASGEVIGINSAKINNSAVEGMGFAIPISDAGEIIQTLMNRETRSRVSENERGILGIRGYDVTSESAQMYNMPIGVYISEITERSGAEDAGLTKGMIITKFEGSSINGMDALQDQLSYYKAGETVTITVAIPEKNGEYSEEKIEVKLSRKS